MSEFKDIYAKEAHAQLLREMRTGVWAHASHLPRESELAAIMGISRTQLRDILAVLECEGFITRRHGVGTLINRHVLNLPTRMDMEQEFMDMIHAGGHTPSVAFTKAEETPATEEEASKLNLQPGTQLMRIQKLCTASKRPAIYCEDIFDAALLRSPVTEQALRAPVFQLLQRVGNIPQKDMFATFNMGVGMIVVVSKETAEAAIAALDCGAYVIGEIVAGEEKVILE